MIATALLKNESMRLVEFSACRDRLEEEGMAAMGKVFEKQRSLVKLEVYQNGSKRGLAPLLAALVQCKETLAYVDIQDNKSINRAIPELVNFLSECKNIETLNISDLELKRKHVPLVKDALVAALNSGSKLRELIWNYDLSCSPTQSTAVATALSQTQSIDLKSVEMVGVFQSQQNRNDIRKLFNASISVRLFKPDYTDDESDDHDISEEESQADEEDSHSSQEEEQK